MDVGEVVGGEYKGYNVAQNIIKKEVYIVPRFSLNKNRKVALNSDIVKRLELKSESGSSARGSLINESIWGTAAAINKANAKSKVLVEIEYIDGKKSLIQCSKKMYQAIEIACYK